ncbi:MAG: BMP family ABC transporter substrate-binding protein [Hyphomicrobiales bacterium]|nr:MAG: BMP family ABC transporter substrate-binding protein [Hyphomicrobiales bacterium]
MKFSTLTKAVAGGVALSAVMAGAAFADAALVYDGGGKFDKSFNEAAYNGAEMFKAEGGAYQDLEISGDAMREQAIRQFASRGNNPIVMPGFSWETALKVVAPEFPDTKFTIIDTVVDLPNVQSVVFKEQEGSYLVGVLAAMKSESGKIGVDSNQNHLHPGSVLTSMIKRVDVATYNAMKGVEDGTWAPGTIVLGLAEDGVGAAFDDNNASLVTDEMKAAVEKATADIVSGAVTVHDFRSDKACPSL